MASVISLLKSIDRSKLHAGVPLQSFSMGEVILIGVVGWLVNGSLAPRWSPARPPRACRRGRCRRPRAVRANQR